MDTTQLIHTRGRTHGDYSIHAKAAQDIKWVMAGVYKISLANDDPVRSWDMLTAEQRESLEMIAHKIGRILAGDPDFRDHWDDIAGYAKLVADRCSK